MNFPKLNSTLKATQIPELPFEEYQVCLFQSWRAGEFAFLFLSLLYGVLHPSFHRSRALINPRSDCLAFFVIVYCARKRSLLRISGVQTLLGNIFKGATVYFLVVFVGDLIVVFTELFAPVSDLPTDSFLHP